MNNTSVIRENCMNICNFRTLDRFRRSWRAAVVPLWDLVLADLLLQGDFVGQF